MRFFSVTPRKVYGVNIGGGAFWLGAVVPPARSLNPAKMSLVGSLSWTYVAPFGEDAEVTLSDAQTEVLRARAYGKPYARGEPRAKSVDALRRASGEAGTFSIIDVVGIGAAPGPGIAGPLPAALLKRLLGNVRPSVDQVRKARTELLGQLKRGEAAYVVCWSDDQPSEVFFMGWSFD